MAAYKTISAQEFYEMDRGGYTVVDMRNPEDIQIFIDEHAVAKACEETGTLVEINARHKHPDVDDLRIYKEYDVKFVINSDAHRPKYVGRFAESLALAMEAGIDPERIVNIQKK